jgi:hypothetical protein
MQMRGVCYANIWSSSTVMLAGIDYSITAIISDSLFSKVRFSDSHPAANYRRYLPEPPHQFQDVTNPANLVLSP